MKVYCPFLFNYFNNQKYSIGEKHKTTISQLTNWKKPVDTVVGFVQYLSDFLKNKQHLLHRLRKQVDQGWSEENKAIVEEIQTILLNSDQLSVPDHQSPIHIFTDAGNEGYASGIFISEVNKPFSKMNKVERTKLKLCAFYSKDCSDIVRWKNRSTYEQELYGLVDAQSRYSFYITGADF